MKAFTPWEKATLLPEDISKNEPALPMQET